MTALPPEVRLWEDLEGPRWTAMPDRGDVPEPKTRRGLEHVEPSSQEGQRFCYICGRGPVNAKSGAIPLHVECILHQGKVEPCRHD